MLAAGLGVFGLIAAAARFNDKASRVPYVSCFDELSGWQCTLCRAQSSCLMHDCCSYMIGVSLAPIIQRETFSRKGLMCADTERVPI